MHYNHFMFSLCGHLIGEWSLSVFKRVHFCVVISVVFANNRNSPGQTFCSTLHRAGDVHVCTMYTYMCTHVKLFVVHSRHLSSVQCLVKCVRVCVHTHVGQMMPQCLAETVLVDATARLTSPWLLSP